MHEFLVDCDNPVAFDTAIRLSGAAELAKLDQSIDYERNDPHFIMRIYRNVSFLCYTIEHQGYGQVLEPYIRE